MSLPRPPETQMADCFNPGISYMKNDHDKLSRGETKSLLLQTLGGRTSTTPLVCTSAAVLNSEIRSLI